MRCYIKDFKTFLTIAKFDATSYSLPDGTKGEIVIYQKDPVDLRTKYVGMWVIINSEIFYISEVTPNDDYVSLEIQPPIYAFTRQVEYDGSTTYGTLITNILNNDFGANCSDTEYRLNYLSVTNTDTTACLIETDDYGFIIPCDIFDDALYAGVAIDFSYTNTELNVDIHTANYDEGVVAFNDGKTILEAESYDPNFIAKVTVLHRLETENEGDDEFEEIHYYLSTDNQISTTPPVNRAKGIWKYYTASADESPLSVAIGAFSHNNDNHKIEFHCPTRFNLYQKIRMRLRGELFNTIITSRVLSSDDSRYYYTCGNLATTLTEKVDAESSETSEEINAIKKQLVKVGAAAAPTVYVDDASLNSTAEKEYTVSGNGTVIVFCGSYSDSTSDYGSWQAEIYYDGTLIMGEGTRWGSALSLSFGASTAAPISVTSGKKIKIFVRNTKLGTKTVYRRFLCFGCTVS